MHSSLNCIPGQLKGSQIQVRYGAIQTRYRVRQATKTANQENAIYDSSGKVEMASLPVDSQKRTNAQRARSFLEYDPRHAPVAAPGKHLPHPLGLAPFLPRRASAVGVCEDRRAR